ncbi:MAG TPA: hypothetical protein VGG33_21895 [Polyangia bacterium]
MFVLLADGKVVGGKASASVAKGTASKPVATERAADKSADGSDDGHGHGAAGKSDKPGDHKKADKADKTGKPGEGDKVDLTAETERNIAPPAGVSAPAWRDEMGARASSQKAITERERLEALSQELNRTRTALREETTRLEGLMDKTRTARTANAGTTANPNGENPAGNSAAAIAAGAPGMSTGDPMAPNAYYRPTPPPPNFAVQVEVVSKAMKSMKPEQAAGILAHLERGLAAEVLQRMRPADAGAILGFLKPEVGAVLAAEIVSRPPVKNRDSDKEKP